jgi:hypothetical protein
MMLPNAKANPPVVRDADADPLFQRGQAKRGASENTCHSRMGKDSSSESERDGVGMPERVGKSEKRGESERVAKSERAGKSEGVAKPKTDDETRINGEFPPLKKGGRGDLLFGHRSPAKPCVIHAAQKIGRR